MRSVMPKVIDGAKEKLVDLYSALGVSNEYYENCISKFNKITHNNLYRTNLTDHLGNSLIGSSLVNMMYKPIVNNSGYY